MVAGIRFALMSEAYETSELLLFQPAKLRSTFQYQCGLLLFQKLNALQGVLYLEAM